MSETGPTPGRDVTIDEGGRIRPPRRRRPNGCRDGGNLARRRL